MLKRILYLGAHFATVRTEPVVSRQGPLYGKPFYKLSSGLSVFQKTPRVESLKSSQTRERETATGT